MSSTEQGTYAYNARARIRRRRAAYDSLMHPVPTDEVRVASFALGDYEWILAFEADELHRILDLMRDLRASGARRHVREEIPFFTGRRRSVSELIAALP